MTSHTINAMSTDGYGNADSGRVCFSGLYLVFPEYLTGTGYQSYNYGNFVTYFYMYLLQYHYSVNSALRCSN